MGRAVSISLVAAVLMTGCFGPTPEEQRQNREARAMMMKMMSQQMNSSITQQTPTKTVEPQMNIISEDALVKKVADFDAPTKGVKFTKYKDGFSINDVSRYIDAEGDIVNYGYDWQTGDVTYMIEQGSDSYKIKFIRVLTSQEAIDIATVKRDGGKLHIKTVTGKTLTSKGIILTSKGFIVLRDATAFTYTIGKGVTSFAAPKGWHIAQFQNGDVASTNYILLERNSVSSDSDIAGLVDSTKSVMNSFGLSDKTDYMLVDMNDPQKQFLLDIDMSDKDIAAYSDCEKMNSYVNKCNNVSYSESLYNYNGLINQGHYFWRIMWYRTQSGKVLAVTKEAGHKKVVITDLVTGDKVEAAYRITGFATLDSSQDATGKITITAGGGLFSDEVIDDAEAYLSNHKNDDK